MKSHPYLRAYMAGVLLPSWFLLLVLAAFLFTHFAWQFPAGIASVMIFPMAVVPNLWGLWNVLYVRLGFRGRISIGAFGALLPLVIIPAGIGIPALAGISSTLDLGFLTLRYVLLLLPVAMAVYYLAWKFVVAFFNRIVGLG